MFLLLFYFWNSSLLISLLCDLHNRQEWCYTEVHCCSCVSYYSSVGHWAYLGNNKACQQYLFVLLQSTQPVYHMTTPQLSTASGAPFFVSVLGKRLWVNRLDRIRHSKCWLDRQGSCSVLSEILTYMEFVAGMCDRVTMITWPKWPISLLSRLLACLSIVALDDHLHGALQQVQPRLQAAHSLRACKHLRVVMPIHVTQLYGTKNWCHMSISCGS